MAVAIVVIVALGLGVHIFEITMKAGATQAGLSRKKMFAFGAVFGGIQALLMLLGLFVTWLIEETCEMTMIHHIYRNVSVICLFFLIAKDLFEGIHMKEFLECRAEPLSLKQWVLQAVRVGVETFIVGMSMTYLNPDTLYDMVCILCVSIMAAVGGLWVGYWSGVKGQRVLNFSGAVLLGIAGIYVIVRERVGI